MSKDRIKVLYIVGSGRSGSTLLDRMLGNIEGFCAVGELTHMWDKGLQSKNLCGCGVPVLSCAFWNTVLEEAFGGLHGFNVKLADAFRARWEHIRNTHLVAFLLAANSSYVKRHLESYLDVLANLYRAIQTVSGCRVIIDSSKLGGRALLLSQIDDIDLHVLHLTRDSRAVTYSWGRKKLAREITDRVVYMPVTRPTRASMRWNQYNLAAHPIRRWSPTWALLHYESLVENPPAVLVQLAKYVGEGSVNIGFLRNTYDADLHATHTVFGNPSRFQSGSMTIKPDDEWRAKMPRHAQHLVTLLTWPLMLDYGYLKATHAEHKYRGRWVWTP